MAAALDGLIGPLTFASRGGFAGVARMRGIEGLVRGRLEAARAEDGADPAWLDRLAAQVAGVDALPETDRVAAVRALVRMLGERLELPPELRAAAAEGPAPEDPAPMPAAEGPRQAEGARPAPSPAVRPATDVRLDAPVAVLPGVGPGRAEALKARGVATVRDLLWMLPVSWESRTHAGRIADVAPGTKAVVVGTVEQAGEKVAGARRRRIFEAVVGDGTGRVRVSFFRSGAWAGRKLRPGATVALSGAVRVGFRGMLEMAHPEILDPAVLAAGPDEAEDVLARYPEVENVHPRALRAIVGAALPYAPLLPETLPPALVGARALPALGEALAFLHAPPAGTPVARLQENATEAHRRLIYEEFFFLQLGLALKARGVKVTPGVAFPVGEAEVGSALSLLPFPPTGAQRRVIREIAGDMAAPQPMNRLLQGDVGSGKTAVAAVALAMAARAGWQGAVMAPTELLAEQHGRTLGGLLEPAGLRTVVLTGSLGAAARREALAAIEGGDAAVVVGTHALIQEGVAFRRLGLVVVDEQHRFGVRQRLELMQKGSRPDVLVMTATPIPRTLAMTAYGDLDLSVIDEMPPGRTPVETRVFRARDRARVEALIRREVEAGHQAYVVYPLVETSERLEDVKAASEMAEHLAREVFPDLRLGLLHGRMSPADKEAVMRAFAAGELHVLVATTVIEVGIDVPNASVMVIEHAERFGLSQLHQLRGRVGRGAARSYCLLVAHEIRGEKVRDRLSVMEATTDGFRIAEEDLRIRGPGELLGTRQSGHPDLLFGNLARDRTLLSQARQDALALIAEDPALERPEHAPAAAEVLARWGGRLSLGRVA